MLEVGKDADDRTIKKAYRKKAAVFHPDKVCVAEREGERGRLLCIHTHIYMCKYCSPSREGMCLISFGKPFPEDSMPKQMFPI